MTQPPTNSKSFPKSASCTSKVKTHRDKNRSRNRDQKSHGAAESGEFYGMVLENSARTRNCKKGRIVNDLVNFDYYHPQRQQSGFAHHRSKKFARNYEEKDYLQLCCQFVIPANDLQTQISVDSSVNWNDVVQVRMPCEELSVCPICLYPPICPLSPVCGHAMCYPCALRFQELCPAGDCPICHKVLIMADFRPLKTFTRKKYSVGDDIVFKLMCRLQNSRIVYPINANEALDEIPNISSEFGSKFCNVIKATPLQVLQEVFIAQEEELKTQLALVDDSDRECEPYIIQALTEIETKKNICFQELKSISENDESIVKRPTSVAKKVCFYQCEDGQPIFIHPLNSRCLIQEYSSIETAIPELSCRIIAIEQFTQSPDIRSRYRYFSHLPLGCPFILAEVDLTPFISNETYNRFKDSIEKRQSLRSAKERKEDRYSKRLAEKEKEKEVIYHPSAYLPRYSEGSSSSKEQNHQAFESICDGDSSAANHAKSSDHPLSFAEKLRIGASKSTPWVSNSPVPSQKISSCSTDDSDIPLVPSFQASFTASLNDAFIDLNVQSDNLSDQTHRGKKKKKKFKTISLTGGARRG